MKIGLLGKMLASILLPAIIGLLLVSGLSYRQSEQTLRQQSRNDILTMLDMQAVGLQALFGGLDDSLGMLSTYQRINALLTAYTQGADEAQLHKSFVSADNAFKDFTDHNGNVAFAGLIAADGKVLAHHVAGSAEPSKSVGKNYSGRGYFQRGMTGENAVESLRSATTGKITTILAMPIKSDGKIAGVLFAGINNEVLSAHTVAKSKFGEKGSIYAYGPRGRVMLHKDAAAMGRDDSASSTVQYILKTKNGTITYLSNLGEEKTIYFKELPSIGWILCLEFDRAEIYQPLRDMFRYTLVATAICALLVGLIIFFAARGIVRLLGGISGIAEAVAKGRLETNAKENSVLTTAHKRKDEFSTLAAGMEHMVGNIKKLLGESEQKTHEAQQATDEARQATARAEEATHKAEAAKREGMLAAANQLEEAVGIISSASSQLSAQIDQSDHIAAESAQRLSEAATAMNEMNATVQEVARNASSASAVSVETRTNAEGGAKIVEKALQSIDHVHTVSLALKDDMTTLNEHAQAITQIMNVISDIADQTNLLALNAAIEAARAGEAGRGFAVVADEVRKLAEKTMASTHDVGNAITAIQQSASQSVAAMDNALEQVNTATDFANQSGAALRDIVGNVEATADQVGAIATASEQQSAASEEINQSIVQVNEMSGQTAQAMGEAAKAVADLAQQARRLGDLIAEMKRG